MNFFNITYTNFLTSPLEQFIVFPLWAHKLGLVDFSITNPLINLLLLLFILFVFYHCTIEVTDENLPKIHSGEIDFWIVPTRLQSTVEMLQKVILSMVSDNIKGNKGARYFPLVFFLFMFIFSLNAIGLIPYSFTLTSHIIVTLSIAVAVFTGIQIVGVRKHGIHYFSIFLPPGTPLVLAFLLVPIELISFIFKPISLSIRLFANMMAGHTLLKVIAGFAFTLMSCTGILFLAHYVPVLILIPLMLLELAVALIQSFVFSILICIYINEATNLH